MTYQEQLNRGTRQTNRMVNEVIAAARKLCEDGDFVNGAKAWELASVYCKAMAIGRGIEIKTDSGIIRPMSGDK